VTRAAVDLGPSGRQALAASAARGRRVLWGPSDVITRPDLDRAIRVLGFYVPEPAFVPIKNVCVLMRAAATIACGKRRVTTGQPSVTFPSSGLE